jgi:peptidoglycan-associated lipoprotein
MLLAVALAGCGKKTPVPPPPAPPAGTRDTGPTTAPTPGAPTASLTVEPASITPGQSAVLRWTTTNANDVSINTGIGTVAATGNRTVNPTNTTTYTLTANGPAGSTSATATLIVAAPPPPPAPPARISTDSADTRIQRELRDALYDYDSNNIRDDARAVLTQNATALKGIFRDFPNLTINVEGHCDERGSAEYNLGLGDRRASSARDFLVSQGIPAEKLKTISYGKERPVCTEADETCYQRNRRAHFSSGQ